LRSTICIAGGVQTDFIVANYNSLNTLNSPMGNSLSGADQLFLGGSFSGCNGFGIVNNAGSAVLLSGTTESTAPKICTINDNRIFVNGVVEASTTTQIKTALSYNDVFSNRGATVPAVNLIGNIAEILIFNYSMAIDDVLELQSILNGKYAIY
jgi:hypothetical protein